MSYIIGSKCLEVKDGACMDVCPVDCIYESIEQMFINPDECIDCGACVPACPVEAIWDSEKMAVRMGEGEYIKKNYEHFGLTYKECEVNVNASHKQALSHTMNILHTETLLGV